MNCFTTIGRRGQHLIFFTFILTGLIFYLVGIHDEFFQSSDMKLIKSKNKMVIPGFSIYTPGCRIPEMNPFDKSVRKYVKNTSPIQCSNKLPLIESNQTSIWIVIEALQGYNISDLSAINCCYKEFKRLEINSKTINDSHLDSLVSFSSLCTPFKESVNIYSEFIHVKCTVGKKVIYKDFHAFIVPKINKNKITTAQKNDSEGLSVLIIGADAVSRLNFHRKFPKTKNLLLSMGALEFFGYNKVHDNTFPNLVPLLSGYTADEIRDVCWFNDTTSFDNCPWIWKNFSAHNYYTAFGEESYWMGVFNYGKRGFVYPPTDYYLRPYIQANEEFIGHLKSVNTAFCNGARVSSEVLLNYAYKFCVNMTLSNKKFWGLFWENSLTHDVLNIPPNLDDIFYNFFTNLQKQFLNSTALFFLSDHGIRWGGIRQTYQGRVEEHLPFLYILLPNWFKEQYSLAVKNLEQNTRLLTTHFDIHETLKDFLALENLKPENLKSRTEEGWTKRAMSLFLPVSIYRTCESVGIRPTWCTCQRRKKVSISDEKVQMAAKFTVNYINKMLIKNEECATLKLQKIISAHMEIEEDFINSKTKDIKSDYVVLIVTTPGSAKFEATLRHQSKGNELEVLGDISRINIYGSQSKCVSNYRLKLYCYCK